MLFAVGSLGLQRLLIEISAGWIVQVPLMVALLLWAVCTFRGSAGTRAACRRLALLIVLLRFAVPLAALASEVSTTVFSAPRLRKLRGNSRQRGKEQGSTI